MNKIQKKLVPDLRFPEFDIEWDEIELSELLTFKNGINASKEDYGSGYKFINVLDIIQNNYIVHDNIIGQVNVSEANFQKNIVNYGDILFQRSSETREEVGQANVYLDKFQPATFGGFVIRGKAKKEYDPSFMNALLKTARSRKEITTKSGGSTRYNVGQDTLSKVKIYTTSVEEQKKIANFLTAVDQRISLLKQKKAALVQYKKGLMQKIFSQEIRFKDENGDDYPDWVEKRLGDVAELTSSKRVYLSDYVDSGVPFYRGKEISELKLNKSPTDILYISNEAYEQFKNKYGAPIKNDILITAVGTLGNVFRVRNNKEFYFKDGNLIWLRNISENPNFLERAIEWNKNTLVKYSIGSTQKALTIFELNKIIFKFPSLKEQIKIDKYLSSIDQSINKLNSQIELALQFKKGLLQKMFV